MTFAAYGLTYRYPGHEDVALNSVSFEIESGEIMAVLGPNASGKSTLLRLLSGLIPFDSRFGQIKFAGTDFGKATQSFRSAHVAYVGADLRAEFPLTAEQVVMLGRAVHGQGLLNRIDAQDRERVLETMERCRCIGLRHRLLQTLSGGERQLVLLSRALVQDAKVLLLDETLSRMDLHHQAQMGQLLRQLCDKHSYSVMLVAHDVNLATEWADTGLFLWRGESLACGPIASVLSEERLKKLYPNAELHVRPSPISGAPKVFFGAETQK